MGRWLGRSDRADAALLGLTAAVISGAAAGRPSLWVDEAATLSASTRSLGELWALVQNLDAVHGLYYLFMHGWFSVVPVTEFWARLPSALAVGVAGSGVVVLGRLLCARSVGVAAGVVFAVLPRTTLAGIEARPYALTMACAVWLTVLLIVAVRRDRTRFWVGYTAALAVTAALNIVVLLVLAAHAIVLVVLAAPRPVVVRWAIATGAAVLALSSLLVLTAAQQGQIGWIWPVSAVTLGQFFGEQYFPSVYSDGLRAVGPDQEQFTGKQLAVAVGAWARVAPLMVVVMVVAGLAVRMRARAARVLGTSPRPLLCTAAVWTVAPTVVLIGYSVAARPVYQPHYLSFTAPGVALLVGVAVVIVARDTRPTVALLVLIAVCALPNYVAQRGVYAKFGSDYSQVADVLWSEGAPGDCLIVDDAAPPSLSDALEGARARHRDGLREVGRAPGAAQRGELFGERLPARAWADELRTCGVLWTVTDRDRGVPAGFRTVQRWKFNQTEVIRSVR